MDFAKPRVLFCYSVYLGGISFLLFQINIKDFIITIIFVLSELVKVVSSIPLKL